MTNEAVKVELTNSTGNIRRFTVADGTAITKGTLLKLSDPRTALATAATDTEVFAAGIAAEDKEADDGQTSIGVWTDGIFELVASGAIVLGQNIVFIGQNKVAQAASTASGAMIAGYCLETAAAGETVNIRVRL